MRYVALGDSFSEGVGDDEPRRPNGVRGWADRVAERLAEVYPGAEYANLAVRGKLMSQILEDQVRRALAMRPDLVTLYAGGNDLMRATPDYDRLFHDYEEAIGALRASGARVLIWTAYDAGWAPVFKVIRGRAAIYNEYARRAAARTGADLVDFWWMDGYDDWRMWCWDRLHLSPVGHMRMAAEVLDVLGVPHSGLTPDLGPEPEYTRQEVRDANRLWLRGFALPWLGRRLRGVSTGDVTKPRYPGLVPASGLYPVPPSGIVATTV